METKELTESQKEMSLKKGDLVLFEHDTYFYGTVESIGIDGGCTSMRRIPDGRVIQTAPSCVNSMNERQLAVFNSRYSKFSVK